MQLIMRGMGDSGKWLTVITVVERKPKQVKEGRREREYIPSCLEQWSWQH